jgi:hypothetical protein
MQNIFDLWLPKYYPRFNKDKFTTLLQEAHRWRLSSQEFQYIVLGCGYLYQVRPSNPEKAVKSVKRRFAARYGRLAAEAFMDEARATKIIALAKEQGLLIGPQNRRLSERRKPGQLPIPSLRVASLVIARWIEKREPHLISAPWACDLYTALSSRNLTPVSFARYQKVSEKETVSVWIGLEERRIPAIDHLLTFFDNRYGRFMQDGSPIQEAQKTPGVLYPIDFLEPVLRAAGIDIREKNNSTAALFRST